MRCIVFRPNFGFFFRSIHTHINTECYSKYVLLKLPHHVELLHKNINVYEHMWFYRSWEMGKLRIRKYIPGHNRRYSIRTYLKKKVRWLMTSLLRHFYGKMLHYKVCVHMKLKGLQNVK